MVANYRSGDGLRGVRRIVERWSYLCVANGRHGIESAMHESLCAVLTIHLTQTPWSTVLVGKLIVAYLIKKFPAFYKIRRFITVSLTVTSTSPEPDESSPSFSMLLL